VDKPAKAVLTIAGSDPSGGAGIQADLKTFTSLGVYGCAAITSLTVQNTEGVFSANPVEPILVKNQIEKVLADLPISHIKTGMLGNSEISRMVGKCLAGFGGTVVCDPILHSSSGKSLLEGSAVKALKDSLLKRAAVITPNFPEFEALANRKLGSDTDVSQAIEQLFSEHPSLKAIVVKGGHRNEELPEITDKLFLKEGSAVREISSTRIRVKTRNTHGTGCTFASALTAYHLKTDEWEESFRLAGAYLDKLLKVSANLTMGHGAGPLHHHLYNASD